MFAPNATERSILDLAIGMLLANSTYDIGGYGFHEVKYLKEALLMEYWPICCVKIAIVPFTRY